MFALPETLTVSGRAGDEARTIDGLDEEPTSPLSPGSVSDDFGASSTFSPGAEDNGATVAVPRDGESANDHQPPRNRQRSSQRRRPAAEKKTVTFAEDS